MISLPTAVASSFSQRPGITWASSRTEETRTTTARIQILGVNGVGIAFYKGAARAGEAKRLHGFCVGPCTGKLLKPNAGVPFVDLGKVALYH